MSLRYVILPVMLLLLTRANSHAQRSINVHDHLLIRDSNRYLYGDAQETYEGSPFLDDAFVPARVYTANIKMEAIPMRFNIYANVMEFHEGNETFLLEPDPRISKIEIGDQVFVVEHFKVLTKAQNWFMELLEPGKLTMLAKKSVNYRKKNDLQGIPAKFSKLPDTYYCKFGDQSVFKLTSLKNLIGALPDKQPEMTRFVNDQQLSSKNKEDILKFVRYYNSLSASE